MPDPPPPSRGSNAGPLLALGAFVAVLAVAVLVIALRQAGGGASGDPPAPEVTLADLEPALLTLDDVGQPFRPDDGDPAADPLVVPDDAASPICVETANALIGGTGAEQVSAGFEKAEQVASVDHSLHLVARGEPTVDEYLDLLGGGCPTLVFTTTDGWHYELTSTAEPLAGLGSGGVAVSLHVESVDPGGVATRGDVYYVLWERGEVASRLHMVLFDSLDQHPPIDTGWVQGLATTVDARLAAVLGGQSPPPSASPAAAAANPNP